MDSGTLGPILLLPIKRRWLNLSVFRLITFRGSLDFRKLTFKLKPHAVLREQKSPLVAITGKGTVPKPEILPVEGTLLRPQSSEVAGWRGQSRAWKFDTMRTADSHRPRPVPGSAPSAPHA